MYLHFRTIVNGESTEDVMDLYDEMSPVFCHELQNARCQSGEEVVLQCQLCVPFSQSSGFESAPVVFWKDAFGHVIKNCDTHQVTFSQTTGLCTLCIPQCRLSDSGRYICTASNEHGSASTSAVLSVSRMYSSLFNISNIFD
jgi:hypothetical protein